ncbi:MAG: hypothetical protein AB1Z23_00310 [Eubacteriales bacterium]
MRADGRRIKSLDPMFLIIPHLMTKRYDAQVSGETEINYTQIKRYINKKAKEGISISFMSVLIAAYLRMITHMPELNRFIINRKIYARNDFWVSFVVLKKQSTDDSNIETVAKIKFELNETIFDVARKIIETIDENRKTETENMVDKLAKFFMSIPLLSRVLIDIVKFFDQIGILPKSFLDDIPFHTSLFVTNMASINTGSVYHHVYDFGTTSVFISIGKPKFKNKPNGEKTLNIPLGVVVDERICAGVTFARAYGHLTKYLSNPELLEVPPESIKEDVK